MYSTLQAVSVAVGTRRAAVADAAGRAASVVTRTLSWNSVASPGTWLSAAMTPVEPSNEIAPARYSGRTLATWPARPGLLSTDMASAWRAFIFFFRAATTCARRLPGVAPSRSASSSASGRWSPS